MAATGLVLNVSSLTFGGTTYTKVTAVNRDRGGNLIGFSGDTNVYDVVMAAGKHDPSMSFTVGDVGAAETLNEGTSGTLVVTMADAKGQVGGAVVLTATSNAYVANVQSGAQHAQYGSATVTFKFTSSDGTTNPIVVSRT